MEGHEELSAQERHDQGHELTDGDIRELERGEQQTATDADAAADADGEKGDNGADVDATYTRNDDGSYTRDADGVQGSFGPDGFTPAGESHGHWL